MPRALNVFCGTWNVNGKMIKESLDPWLLPSGGMRPDLYVIGFQEFDLTRESFVQVDQQRVRKWEEALLACISKIGGYSLVAKQQLVGIFMIIYSKDSLTPLISDIDTGLIGTGYEGTYGNKGAVAIRFRIGSDTFCFLNSHLNAHVHNVERRRNDYESICSRMSFFPKSSTAGDNKTQPSMELPPGFVTDDRAEESGKERAPVEYDRVLKSGELTIFDHDHLIWLGDLNYRIDLERDEIMESIEKKDWARLAQADQLVKEISQDSTFSSFQEGPLAFLPTYKFDSGTNNFDSSRKMRLPAYCDRVLWKRDPAIQALHYTGHMELMVSDHKPVSALLRVLLKEEGGARGEGRESQTGDWFQGIFPYLASAILVSSVIFLGLFYQK